MIRGMLYFNIIQFSFLRLLAYPIDILVKFVRQIIGIVFLIYFWTLFSQSGNFQYDLRYFASYFLIATGISILIMNQWGEFEGYIGRSVKTGFMSNYLLRPYNTLKYLHAMAIGAKGVDMFFGVLYISVGILIQPKLDLLTMFIFLIFFVLAYAISFAINIITGTIYFHVPIGNGILNAINHTKWILSGLLVPIILFPEPFKTIVFASPFPWLVFGPINVLKNNPSAEEIMFGLLVALFWSILLNLVAIKFWNFSTKKYEAVGI